MLNIPVLVFVSVLSVAPGHSPVTLGADCATIQDLIIFLDAANDPNAPSAGSIGGCFVLGGELTLTVTGVFPPGQPYLIIDNDGTDPIIGTLDGLPEGALVASGGQVFRISYQGGSGNDLTLTAVAAPAVPTLTDAALLAFCMLVVAVGMMKIQG